MGIDKSLVTRSTSLLLLHLLEEEDMYGYRMIEELAKRSDDTFRLKAGTLYPLLHDLQAAGMVEVYEKVAETGRLRKYYSLTKAGRGALGEKRSEWREFYLAVNKVLEGGARLAAE